MDDEPLWNTVYRTVCRVAHRQSRPLPRRAGRPDRYATAEVLLVWLMAALLDCPMSRMTSRLRSWRWRSAMRNLGFVLPTARAHRTTWLRRAQRSDFALLLEQVNAELIRKLGPDWCELVIDSSPLPLRSHSRDTDAAWGHHGVYGYRLHTLLSRDGVIVLDQVAPANMHELKIAPALLRAAQQQRPPRVRTRYVSADVGYDSEPLHRCCRQTLGAMLVAPFNDRGGGRTMRKTPLRRQLNRRWQTKVIRGVRRRRTAIERCYSVAKSARFRLYALPPFIRHLSNVRRWQKLKKLLMHADLLLKRRQTKAE